MTDQANPNHDKSRSKWPFLGLVAGMGFWVGVSATGCKDNAKPSDVTPPNTLASANSSGVSDSPNPSGPPPANVGKVVLASEVELDIPPEKKAGSGTKIKLAHSRAKRLPTGSLEFILTETPLPCDQTLGATSTAIRFTVPPGPFFAGEGFGVPGILLPEGKYKVARFGADNFDVALSPIEKGRMKGSVEIFESWNSPAEDMMKGSYLARGLVQFDAEICPDSTIVPVRSKNLTEGWVTGTVSTGPFVAKSALVMASPHPRTGKVRYLSVALYPSAGVTCASRPKEPVVMLENLSQSERARRNSSRVPVTIGLLAADGKRAAETPGSWGFVYLDDPGFVAGARVKGGAYIEDGSLKNTASGTFEAEICVESGLLGLGAPASSGSAPASPSSSAPPK